MPDRWRVPLPLRSIAEIPPPMAPRAKTRDRIIEASLALFNAQGERNVTTNHIAAHLGISPGNLYYHFRNKQAIIAELFAQYESRVDAFLRRPEGRAKTRRSAPECRIFPCPCRAGAVIPSCERT